ncbi:uncharacterized protein LOC107490502 [Arachis duranensis]|uniref:Uncharacterized protein LOC107490502 n=1 Tax=Arachis duranensis TaxID=130453 RepID=A0A6P4DE32_ARADU|nr:uncharacterized protein LOC107490502 [Arachis duranensis]
MARNFDDMFNEALYGKRRRQDNTLIDNWIDEYLLEDSEEEDIDRSPIPITRRWINRDREAGHDRLFQDYFADEPRVDATGRRGLSPLQKCTAAIRMLAYGVAADAVDDYVRIASSDLWIWHAFFGVSGSNNDINVLDRSPVFDDILNDRALEVNYTINGNNYTMGYYLADGIYPEWATFVKSISKQQGEKRKLFAQYQEEQKKDVERAFGVLQARFAIIRGPARFWEKKKLANIMRACIILHNMIVEDERDSYAGNFAQGLEYDDVENGLSQPQLGEEDFAPYHQFLQRNAQLQNRQQHRQLKEDLIEHIWWAINRNWNEFSTGDGLNSREGIAFLFTPTLQSLSLSEKGL